MIRRSVINVEAVGRDRYDFWTEDTDAKNQTAAQIYNLFAEEAKRILDSLREV
jgi:hypothetical protein